MTTIAEMIDRRYAMAAGIEGLEAAENETVRGLLSRRSIRRYTEQPVDDALLDVLLACAQSAPTKSNLQQYSIVVVRDPAQRKRLAALCPETGQMEHCPALLVFCADTRRNRRIAEMRGHDYANNNMDTFLNAVVDSAIVMQCFITAAEGSGLGCAAISQVRNRIEEYSDVLGLPDGVFPISGLTMGWPAVEGYVNQRLPASVVVHRDRYDESALEEEIAAYDKRRHDIRAVPPESQRHTDKYGVLEVYAWSENVARQLSVPERAGFRDFLKSRGFDLA